MPWICTRNVTRSAIQGRPKVMPKSLRLRWATKSPPQISAALSGSRRQAQRCARSDSGWLTPRSVNSPRTCASRSPSKRNRVATKNASG